MTTSAPEEGAVAFSDLVAFTAFTDVAGDALALAVVDELDGIVADSLPDGSRLIKSLGDGHLLWFPSAAVAVMAALRIQSLVRARRLGGEIPLWLRIGIHWGHPTWRGDDILGRDVNIAARVVDAAGAGEVVVTGEAKRAATDRLDDPVDFVEIGPTMMKGLKDPIWLYRAESTPRSTT